MLHNNVEAPQPIVFLQIKVLTICNPYDITQKKKKNTRLHVRLDSLFFANLFYYSAYFCYYSWASLHFSILFIGPIVLFQLIFTFIYSYSQGGKKIRKCEAFSWFPNLLLLKVALSRLDVGPAYYEDPVSSNPT